MKVENTYSNDISSMKKRLANLKKISPIAQRQSVYPFCSFDKYKEWFQWIPKDYFFSYLKKSYDNVNIDGLLVKPENITYYHVNSDNEIRLKYKDNIETIISYNSPLKLYPDFIANPLTKWTIKIIKDNKSITFMDTCNSWNPITSEIVLYRQCPDNQVFTFLYNIKFKSWVRSDAPYGGPAFWPTTWHSYKLSHFYMGVLTTIRESNEKYILNLHLIKKRNFKLKNIFLRENEREVMADPIYFKYTYTNQFLTHFFETIKKYQMVTTLIYVTEPFEPLAKLFLK